MKIRLYTIRDGKAEAYLQPFFERTDGTAIRAIKKAVKNDGNFKNHAEDYSLWSIGVYDDTNGAIESWVPMHIANLIDVRDNELTEAGKGDQREAGATLSRTEAMMGKDFPSQLKLEGAN